MNFRRSFATRSLRLVAVGAIASGLAATSANALTINDTFLSSITDNATKAAIQAASNAIAALYSDPITVEILFAVSGSVGGGQSLSSIYTGSYASYTGLLSADATANPANTTLATAVANLGSGNADRTMRVTSANLRALGAPVSGLFDGSGTYVGAGGSYDGVITLNPSYATTTSVIQHEIDEILGGGGPGTTLGTIHQGDQYGSLDLYRYSAPGTPSFTTSSGATSYLSVDGGVTPIVYFNQNGSGDYADFTTSPCYVQSWQVCTGPQAYSITSPEYQMMLAIGYDPLVTTPLPAAWTMMLTGLTGFGFVARRAKKKASGARAAA